MKKPKRRPKHNPKLSAHRRPRRIPTSHERASGRSWDDSYKNKKGPAPWDIGAPQPAVVRAVENGAFAGAREILDAGCGTGESSLLLATRGHKVFAFDLAKTAIAIARKKAAARRLTNPVKFTVADALRLERASSLRQKFDAILDCALFHTFNASERARYAANLTKVAKPGALFYILAFSDQGQPADLGPHPVSQADIRAALNHTSGWHVESIDPARISTIFHGPEALPGWWVKVRRK
jgi:SAM-dependent methyltransferase